MYLKRWTAIIVGASALGVLGCVRRPEEPQVTHEAADGSSVSAMRVTRVQLDSRTRGWEIGQRYRYRVKLTSRVAFGANAPAFDFDLQAHLGIAPTSAGANEVTLYATMADAVIVSRVPDTQAEFDKLAVQMNGAGCFLSLSEGRLTTLWMPKGLSGIVANSYRDLVSNLQFARAVDDAEHYEAEEYDTTGKYLAEYQRVHDARAWRKRKEEYLSVLAAKSMPGTASLRVLPKIVASSADVRLSPEGRPAFVKAHNDLTVEGAEVPVHSVTDVVLESEGSVAMASIGSDWDAIRAKLERIGGDEPYGAQATVESLDEARIRGRSFESIVARLEETARSKASSLPVADSNDPNLDNAQNEKVAERVAREDSSLFIALSAIFRRKPETVALAVAKIQSGSPASITLIDAMASASSQEAQHALIALTKSKSIEPKLRLRLNGALARAPRPSDESIAAFKAILTKEPFNTTAILGLGSYSRRLRDQGSEDKAEEIGGLLVQRLRSAPGTTSQITALRGITNSGYAGALSAVIPFLAHENELVRGAAVRSLQSMRDPQVDSLIAARLLAEKSSGVRIAAIEAAQLREPSDILADAIGSATKADDPRVRYRAVEAAIAWLPLRSSMRSILEQVAKSESEERVRERAKTAL